MSKIIRIVERDAELAIFELVVIDTIRKTEHAQGRAFDARNPEQAYLYAQRILPNRVLEGAKWEFRSESGVYVDLDINRLGWC